LKPSRWKELQTKLSFFFFARSLSNPKLGS
jgi:hypothetical protein